MWSSNKLSSSTKSSWRTPQADLKQKQIQSLMTTIPSAQEIIPQSTYQVPIPLQAFTVFLLIKLPPSFPDSPPLIYVNPACYHNWISEGMVVGFPKIREGGWSVHMSLGSCVKEIMQEFQTRPPSKDPISHSSNPSTSRPLPPPPRPHTAVGSYQPPPYQYPANNYASTSQSQSQSQYNLSPSTTVQSGHDSPIRTAKLEPQSFNLPDSIEELEELQNDDDVFDDFFMTLDQVKNMLAVEKELRQGNATIAERNISKKDALSTSKQRVRDLQEEQFALRKGLDEKMRMHAELMSKYHPSTLLTLLRQSINQADGAAEEIATKFLDRDSQVDTEMFLKKYRDIRKLVHLRTSKLEIVSERGEAVWSGSS